MFHRVSKERSVFPYTDEQESDVQDHSLYQYVDDFGILNIASEDSLEVPRIPGAD